MKNQSNDHIKPVVLLVTGNGVKGKSGVPNDEAMLEASDAIIFGSPTYRRLHSALSSTAQWQIPIQSLQK